MDIFIKVVQVILALSVLITVHEFGHFFWAKVFKIKVEKFYLFFDIGGKALAKWKWGETEFGIGWLPFGGYCKIAGMVDESLDKEQLNSEPKAYEFRSHKASHRLMVMIGGVINNFIFAILCYSLILSIWGQAYIPNQGNRIYTTPLAEEMGFKNGDEILSFDNYTPKDFSMLSAEMLRRNAHSAKVLRDGDTLSLYIDQGMFAQVINSPMLFDLAIPFVVDSVTELNADAGLKAGDRIVAFDGQSVEFVQDSRAILENRKAAIVSASVVRGADTLMLDMQVDTSGRIGVYMQNPNLVVHHYSLLESIPAGLVHTGKMISGYLQDLSLIARPNVEAYKSVGSFISIAQVFPGVWDWYKFLNILALLSIVLGVFNILPIPALDGGHIFFLLIEIISGRKPSQKVLFVTQTIGMLLLMGLMILAMWNDITKIL